MKFWPRLLGLAGAGDEDVDQALGAFLGVGAGVDVEDADEGAEEVLEIDVGAEVAAEDGALDEGGESALDEAAGAGKEFGRAAGDAVEGGGDDLLGGDVVDEEKHPGAEGFKGWEGCGESALGGGELFDFAAVDGLDELVAGGEVAIEGAGTDGGLAGDVVEAGGGAMLGEGLLGDFKNALAVAQGVGAGLAGLGGGFCEFSRHGQKKLNPEAVSAYLMDRFGGTLRFIGCSAAKSTSKNLA